MPLTSKGKKIKKSMEKTYGKEKGDEVFYKSERSGKLKGVKNMAKSKKPSGKETKKPSKGKK